MYFYRYVPATNSQTLKTARAQLTYNRVCRFSEKAEPNAKDYYNYIVCCRIGGGAAALAAANIYEHKLNNPAYAAELRAEVAEAVAKLDAPSWAEIMELVRNQGQPLHNQHVAYFAIIDGGVKCGEAQNLVQRYCNINRTTPIQKMWYVKVGSKAQAQAAEHALHITFDHARCMSRQQNKKDYYSCDTEQAQKFVTANAHKIYQAIMDAIEGIE